MGNNKTINFKAWHLNSNSTSHLTSFVPTKTLFFVLSKSLREDKLTSTMKEKLDPTLKLSVQVSSQSTAKTRSLLDHRVPVSDSYQLLRVQKLFGNQENLEQLQA